MSKQPSITEMAEINNLIVTSENFRNAMIVVDVDASPTTIDSKGHSMLVHLNALYIILIQQGSAKISLDYVHYTLEANSFLIIIPSRIFQIAERTSDLKASLLIVDPAFIKECTPEKQTPSMVGYMQLRNNPCITLFPEETEHLRKGFELLREKIRLNTHSFHKELVQNAFIGFMLDVANVLIGKKESLKRSEFSRKEELMNRFLELLFAHVRTSHAVTFYADKLFITPQYLSSILKELSGKSTNKWIDEALITEAKILLKTSRITVQQITDQLNFSDQSTFGKFFKKHTGISPKEYRKS